jgi:tripartite-type tricarboxylate transporter receptor subunit TctC
MAGLRKFTRLALLALISSLCSSPAIAAGDYPSRLVKVILPFPPGSTLDALARVMTDQMAQKWGQPVVIENVTGGGGNIGTDRFARSAPDGYTLMFSPPGPLTINPLLYSDVAFDPTKFVPVTLLARVPNVLIIRNNLGVTSVSELIGLARANPGKLTYASQGVGSTAFLTAKLFETTANIAMVHVPYRGAAPALNDIVAGHVDMMFDTFTTSLPQHQAGKVKMVAVASPQRQPAVPDVPAIAELYPGYRSITWFGIVAPPGTPVALADRINRDVAEIFRRPEVRNRLDEMKMEAVGSTRPEAARFFAEEAALWGKVIEDAKIAVQ